MDIIIFIYPLVLVFLPPVGKRFLRALFSCIFVVSLIKTMKQLLLITLILTVTFPALSQTAITGTIANQKDSFIRISRSTLINTDHISEIRKSFNGSLVFVMKDREGIKLSSSRRYGEVLRGHFDI